MTVDTILCLLGLQRATKLCTQLQETKKPAPLHKEPKTTTSNAQAKRLLLTCAIRPSQRQEGKCVADIPTHSSTTNTAVARRPLRREIRVQKGAGVPFGIAISRLRSSVYITGIDRGSPAWRAGLNIGDRIDIVNELHVHQTRVSAQAVMQELTRSTDVDITICEAPLLRCVVVTKGISGQKLGLQYKDLQISAPHAGTALASAGEHVTGLGLLQINDRNATSLPPELACKVASRWFSSKGSVELTLAPSFFVEEVMYVRQLQASRRAVNP